MHSVVQGLKIGGLTTECTDCAESSPRQTSVRYNPHSAHPVVQGLKVRGKAKALRALTLDLLAPFSSRPSSFAPSSQQTFRRCKLQDESCWLCVPPALPTHHRIPSYIPMVDSRARPASQHQARPAGSDSHPLSNGAIRPPAAGEPGLWTPTTY